MVVYRCQNCDHVESNPPEAKDLEERLDEDGVFADRECSRCGALTYGEVYDEAVVSSADLTIAAQRILYAYGRVYETLDLDYGPLSREQAAELSEASAYLAEAYEGVTGEKIGPAFLSYSRV